jgi:hypothetical protein
VRARTHRIARSAVVAANGYAIRRLPFVVAVPAALARAATVADAGDIGTVQVGADGLALAVVAAECIRLTLHVCDGSLERAAAADHILEATDRVVEVTIVGAFATARDVARVLALDHLAGLHAVVSSVMYTLCIHISIEYEHSLYAVAVVTVPGRLDELAGLRLPGVRSAN